MSGLQSSLNRKTAIRYIFSRKKRGKESGAISQGTDSRCPKPSLVSTAVTFRILILFLFTHVSIDCKNLVIGKHSFGFNIRLYADSAQSLFQAFN